MEVRQPEVRRQHGRNRKGAERIELWPVSLQCSPPDSSFA
jgi:hypothetical protein